MTGLNAIATTAVNRNVARLLRAARPTPRCTSTRSHTESALNGNANDSQHSSLFPEHDQEKEEESSQETSPAVLSSQYVLLFPGQGSQFVGMSEHLPRSGPVAEVFEVASEQLGWDVRQLCEKGPTDSLADTRLQQPAILTCSIAAVQHLHAQGSRGSCGAVAGYSLGELAAMWAAGCISLSDVVELARVRGVAMHQASEEAGAETGMMTVFIGADSLLGDGCHLAEKWCRSHLDVERPICSVSAYLFPGCRVVSGHKAALQFLADKRRPLRLRHCQMLPVSGAFHSAIMSPAISPLKEALNTIELRPPSCPLYMNACGTVVTTEAQIRRNLLKQLVRPVLWEQIMHRIYQRPPGYDQPVSYECGPGRVLRSILIRINGKAAKLARTPL